MHRLEATPVSLEGFGRSVSIWSGRSIDARTRTCVRRIEIGSIGPLAPPSSCEVGGVEGGLARRVVSLPQRNGTTEETTHPYRARARARVRTPLCRLAVPRPSLRATAAPPRLRRLSLARARRSAASLRLRRPFALPPLRRASAASRSRVSLVRRSGSSSCSRSSAASRKRPHDDENPPPGCRSMRRM